MQPTLPTLGNTLKPKKQHYFLLTLEILAHEINLYARSNEAYWESCLPKTLIGCLAPKHLSERQHEKIIP